MDCKLLELECTTFAPPPDICCPRKYCCEHLPPAPNPNHISLNSNHNWGAGQVTGIVVFREPVSGGAADVRVAEGSCCIASGWSMQLNWFPRRGDTTRHGVYGLQALRMSFSCHHYSLCERTFCRQRASLHIRTHVTWCSEQTSQ